MKYCFFKFYRVSDLLDYAPEDLVGKSMYALCHAEDANRMRKHHMDRKFLNFNTLLVFEINLYFLFLFSSYRKGPSSYRLLSFDE